MPLPIFAVCNASEDNFMPAQPIACPHCGLTLTVKMGTVTDYKYDAEEWKRLCEHPDLGTPIFCLPSQMLRPPPNRRR